MEEKTDRKQKIDFSTVTACGECCTSCSKKLEGICKGCIEADGYVPEWAGSGRCKVHACAREHNVQFCGICGEFPCEKLPSVIHWNPDIINHLNKLAKQYRGQEDKILRRENHAEICHGIGPGNNQLPLYSV